MKSAPAIFLLLGLCFWGTICMPTKNENEERAEPTWHYTPVNLQWQYKAQRKLGVDIRWCMERYWKTQGSPLTSPRYPDAIKGDGNCFFRAISYIVTGLEDSHEKIRQAVVDYMKNNMEGDVSEKHLTDMAQDKTWASDAEIIATARLLETPVFVYTPYGDKWQWVQYTPNPDYSLVMEDDIPRIYLKMVDNSHFEVVSEVEPSS